MNITEAPIPGVLVFEPRLFHDHRGVFVETWNQARYELPEFVQDNLSRSSKGVLRGLHYQHPNAQGKLVTVVRGKVWDVVVDLRRGSGAFGLWWGLDLSADDFRQLWVPEGCAHGFVALTDHATVSYKCSAPYSPEDEHTLRWDDPQVGIEWPVTDPELSEKDRAGLTLSQLGDALPRYP